MSKFFSSELANLTPYIPGEQPRDMKYIKLNTNESPFPPSEKAVELAKKESERLNLYPDPTCKNLCDELADTLGIASDEVILGNGSDEILFFAFKAFCDKKTKAAFPNISYGFYEVFAGLCGIEYEKVAIKDDFSIDPADYYGINKTVFIANPNAPTSLLLSLDDIEKIVKANPYNVVVIDEAYIDFGGASAVQLIKKYENLLVVQTFSKSRSMAGARLGMGIGSKELIRDLNTVKYSLNPYNINKMTMAAGLGVLKDAEYTKKCCEKIIENREYTEKKLSMLGFVMPKSYTNFVFAKHPGIKGSEIYLKLKSKGILVRHFSSPIIEDYNRITIGTKEQMDALIRALEEILEENK